MSEEATKYFKTNIDKCITMTDFEFAESYAQSKLKAVEGKIKDLEDALISDESYLGEHIPNVRKALTELKKQL